MKSKSSLTSGHGKRKELQNSSRWLLDIDLTIIISSTCDEFRFSEVSSQKCRLPGRFEKIPASFEARHPLRLVSNQHGSRKGRDPYSRTPAASASIACWR